MPIRTTAIEIARKRGMTIAQLATASGLSNRVLYYLRDGRQPGAESIEALMRVFPDLTFDQLFVPADSATVQERGTTVQETEELVA